MTSRETFPAPSGNRLDVRCHQGASMNFHEYQSRQLFADYAIPVPMGKIATTPEQAVEAARALGGEEWVVKAQIQEGAGSRLSPG